MANANIDLNLLGGEAQGSLIRYKPGEEIKGEVVVFAQGNINCNHLYVRLQWHTEGRGDRDTGIAEELDVYQGELKDGRPYQYTFSFTAPNEPWSYAGHYINIIWEIAVVIDVPRSSDPKHNQPFILDPR